MRGGVVEKDDQMVPRIKLDQDFTQSSRIDRHAYGQQSRSLEHLDAMDTVARGRSLTEHNGPLGTSLSLSPGVLRMSDLALNKGMDDSFHRKETLSSGSSVSGDFVARSHSHSTNYTSHSSTSSSVANSVPKRSVAGSHSGTRTGTTKGNHSYTAAVAYTTNAGPPTSMSSLGYGSNDSGSSMDSQSLNHAHRHAPYESLRMRPMSGHSEMEVVSERDGRSASFTTRPSSLALGPKPGVQGSGLGGKVQFFYCPNCRQSFSCVGKDSFDSWFDHVKGCSAWTISLFFTSQIRIIRVSLEIN